MMIVSALFFIFAMICTMPWFSSTTIVFAIFTVLCTIDSIFLVRLKNRMLRLLLSLVPVAVTAVAFYGKLRENYVAAIFAGLAAIFFTVYMTVGRFNTEYWKSRRTYVALASVSAFITALNILIYVFAGAEVKARMNLPGIIGFTIACALSGMIVLSEMRKGNPDTKWRTMNAGRLVLLFAVSAAALALLYLGLSFVFSNITPTLGRKAPKQELEVLKTERIRFFNYSISMDRQDSKDAYKDANENMEDNMPLEEEEHDFPWLIVSIGAFILIAGAVTVIVIRKRRNAPEEEEIQRSPEEQARLDKVEKVRAIYRQYISFVRKSGADLTKGSTSADILESSMELGEEAGRELTEDESALREIYIRARYGDPAAITDGDVADAARLLAKITGTE